MKDFIYLDTDLANSYLAQIDEGILMKMIKGIESSDSHQENGGETLSNEGSLSVGVPTLASGNGKHSKTEYDTFSQVSTKTASNLAETALSDYAIDLLINKIDDRELKNNLLESDEGDFILVDVPFKVYDFEFMNNCIDLDLLKALEVESDNEKKMHKIEDEIKEYKDKLKLLNKPKSKNKLSPEQISTLSAIKIEMATAEDQLKEAKKSNDIFELLSKLTKFGDSLFPNAVLVSSDNYLAYCTREKFRVSQAQLSAISETKRNIKIFATVSTIKDNVNKTGEVNNIPDMDLNMVPTLFSDVILGQFNLLSKGDRLLRPISIYFD